MTVFKDSKADLRSEDLDSREGGIFFSKDGEGVLQNPRLTTAQRDALSPQPGEIVYNSTTNKLNFYNGSAWEVVTSV